MQLFNVRPLKFLRINGIVLYPFIFYAEKAPAPEVLIHERIHWQQIERDGVIRFYFRYLKEYVHGRRQGLTHHQAYLNISYEQEAYAHQDQQSYQIKKNPF
jgi:hypothetical protein